MMGIVMHTISLVRSAAALVVIAAATSFAASASASPFLPFGQPSQRPDDAGAGRRRQR